jgi:hypothetical protein
MPASARATAQEAGPPNQKVSSRTMQAEHMYRLQFLGHRVEPYATLATG